MRRVILLAILIAAAAFARGEKPADYVAAAALVKDAHLSDAFARVAVKADRPMPWAVFVERRYADLKGPSKKAGGDLPSDADAAIWLAILDSGYRNDAKLVFVEGGKVPGVTIGKWISLRDFQNDILPKIMALPHGGQNDKQEEAINKFGARVTSLHRLSWEGLLLVPGTAEEGWQPLNAGHPAWKYVTRLNAAYKKGDAAAMEKAAASLAAALAGQGSYPSQAKLTLERYLRKFGVLKIGFFLYIASSLLFFVWAAFGKKALATAGAWVAFAGFVFITAGLTGRSIVAGYLPTTGMYEYLSLLSWGVVLFFLAFYAKTRQAFLGTIVMPVSFILIVLASLFPAEIEGQLIPALQSWWLTIHVTLACLGEGAFAVGFAAALLYLFRGDKPSRYLPSKETLDVLGYRAFAIGYPLFTIGGLVAGAIWAQKAWSVWWSWDPKETASLVVFLIATAYLHARHVRGWRGTRAAILGILIFLSSVFTLFANLIFGGLHAYGL